MLPEDRKSRGYFYFTEYLKLIKGSISEELPKSFISYSRESLLARLIQQLSTDGLYSFMSKVDSEGQYKSAPKKNVDFGTFLFDLKSKRLIIPCRIFLKNIFLFIVLWIFALFSFISSFIFRKVINTKTVLIYGVPHDLRDIGTLNDFESFCFNEVENPFSKDFRYIVQAWGVKGTSERIFYSRYPILRLLTISRFGFLDFFVFLREHGLVLFNFLFHSLKSSAISVLWRDIALHSVINLLNRKEIITSFMLTNVHWNRQYIWMSDLHGRKFKTYMIPYSMNFSPLKYKNNETSERSPHPHLEHLRVDEIWVWSSVDILELKKLGIPAQAFIKKPVLWCPDVIAIKDKSPKFIISIFDIPPKSAENLAITGVKNNYYSCETVEKFVKDIVEICLELSTEFSIEFELRLKQKRGFSIHHDKSYINFINGMVDASHLKLINYGENLFSIIRASDLVISIPFSSPSYIARAIGKDAIFYDSSDSLQNDNVKNLGIDFFSDKLKLRSYIREFMSHFIGMHKSDKNL